MSHSAKQLLINARESIAVLGWTKNTNAKDRHLVPVNPRSIDATCFCAHGALIRNYNKNFPETLSKAEDILDRLTPGDEKNYVGYNDADSTSKNDIIVLFDKAIAQA